MAETNRPLANRILYGLLFGVVAGLATLFGLALAAVILAATAYSVVLSRFSGEHSPHDE